MKRKRLVLTTLLLACVAVVVVPNWKSLWWAVAHDRVSAAKPKGALRGMYCLHKRQDWLPGREVVVPSPLCAVCQLDEHEYCVVGFASIGQICVVEEGYLKIIAGGPGNDRKPDIDEHWECACPNNFHPVLGHDSVDRSPSRAEPKNRNEG